MATAQQEHDEIQLHRKTTSRFVRVALHVHSPLSHDFGSRTCDKNLNNRERLSTKDGTREFLSALRKNLDLVAITDHMACAYAVELSKLAAHYPEFALLPGMEVNVRLQPPLDSLRIHILALFPSLTAVDQINRIFADTEDVQAEEGRDQKTCEVTNVQLPDFVTAIRKAGGLCVLAHVNQQPTGIRYLFHQTAKDVLGLLDPSGKIPAAQLQAVSESFKTLLARLDIHGVEVSKPEDRKHYAWIQTRDGQRRNIPVLLSLDAHSIED